MDEITTGTRLRIYLSSTDKFEHQLLYEAIIVEAKRQGIAGATVFKGIMGYGQSSTINSQKFWEITEKLPIVIEIVDTQEKIIQFLRNTQSFFDKITKGFLITSESVTIELVREGKKH